MWDSDYNTPEELRKLGEHAESYLNLLTARIRKESFKGETIESILQGLGEILTDETTLFRYSEDIGLNRILWFQGGNMADSITNLVNKCLELNKLEELIDAVSLEYPNIFTTTS